MSQFTQDLVNYSRFRDLPGAVYTRSGVAYQQNASGTWVPFDENVPPISAGVGLGVWEARTNSIRNPTGLGAAAGTPGTLPTNWGRSVAPFSTEVVGASTRNGVPGVLVRIFGTNGGAIAYPAIYTDVATQIAASPGQTWTAQVFTEVVAGSVAGLQPNIQVQELNGSGVYLTLGSIPAAQSFGENRVSRVLSDPSVAYVRLAYVLIVPASASIDCTVFIGGPNLKLGADIKDPPILQTNNAAATRGAASAYINAPGLLVPPFAVQLWFSMPSIDGTLRRFATLSADADENNQIVIERTGGNQFAVQSVVGGVGQTRACLLGGYTGAQTVKSAVRVRAASYQAAVAGVLRGEVAASMPAMTRITLGSRPSFASQINGAIQRFQIINRDLTDAELQALTT